MRYPTMDLEEIKALPIAKVTAKQSHLYLWVPNAMLPEGLETLTAWGFQYKTNITWTKRRKDGGIDRSGTGFYFRNATELLLFGVRGSLSTLTPARRTSNVIDTRRREHSRKPDEQYDLIESCSPGPYLEIFARYAQPGWRVWGDEADDAVMPMGRQHRQRSVAPIDLFPHIEPGVRMDPWLINRVAPLLRRERQAGMTIPELARLSGYNPSRIRRLLRHTEGTLSSQTKPNYPQKSDLAI